MQLSWIDTDAIRAVAAKLHDPVPVKKPTMIAVPAQPPLMAEPKPEINEAAPAFGPTDSQLARIREQLQNIRSKAVEAGLISAEAQVTQTFPDAIAPPPVSAVFQSVEPENKFNNLVELPSSNTLPDTKTTGTTSAPDAMCARLESFARRAKEISGCSEMMLVDERGDVLWNNSMHRDFVLTKTISLTAALRASAQGISSLAAVIRCRISSERELSVIPACPTRHGTLTIALVNALSLSHELVNQLRGGLTQAVEG